jgi:hypothetical protein
MGCDGPLREWKRMGWDAMDPFVNGKEWGGMRCYRFSVSWILVCQYAEATVLVDITFQEGQRTDLFIGWQIKGSEFYEWCFLYHLLNYYCVELCTLAFKIF